MLFSLAPQALSVGIFPYVLKLLQSSARELRPLLVFIWAKILAVDSVSTSQHGCFLWFSAACLLFPHFLHPVALECRISLEALQKDAVLSEDQHVSSLVYFSCVQAGFCNFVNLKSPFRSWQAALPTSSCMCEMKARLLSANASRSG